MRPRKKRSLPAVPFCVQNSARLRQWSRPRRFAICQSLKIDVSSDSGFFSFVGSAVGARGGRRGEEDGRGREEEGRERERTGHGGLRERGRTVYHRDGRRSRARKAA
jgi:hypothetical protein